MLDGASTEALLLEPLANSLRSSTPHVPRTQLWPNDRQVYNLPVYTSLTRRSLYSPSKNGLVTQHALVRALRKLGKFVLEHGCRRIYSQVDVGTLGTTVGSSLLDVKLCTTSSTTVRLDMCPHLFTNQPPCGFGTSMALCSTIFACRCSEKSVSCTPH